MDVKQIKPNHADHVSGYKQSYLNDMYTNETVIAQPKYDGERMLIHFDKMSVACTSRRISKKTNKFMQNEDKLPILQNVAKNINLDYTVLDCECYQKDWSTIVGILHSLPERAIELSALTPPKFAVFDCLWYDGHDIESLSYIERLNYANKVVQKINNEFVHLVQFVNDEYCADDIQNAYFFKNEDEQIEATKHIIDAGFEGIVLKSLNRKYRDVGASIKCKKFETVDVVVYDYIKGNGKYANTVGALCVGYYDPISSTVKHISQVNCGTDEERNKWYTNWNDMKYSVIEVKCQEITETSLRHPVYVRLREDKNMESCTKDTIFK